MHVTRSVSLSRFLISLAALGLLAVFLLFPGQAQAQAAPVITGPAAVSAAENRGAATKIATYMATDTDANTTFMWTLEGTDAGDFNITTNSSGDGELRFNSEPNFESKHVYNVTVKVSDGESNPMTDTLAVTVTVTNVNEAPTISLALIDAKHEENTPTSETITTYQASDPDANTTFTWTLEGDDAGAFNIVTNTEGHGELSFRNVPDYESPDNVMDDNIYNITLEVSDNGSPLMSSAPLSVRVEVENVDEPGTVLIEGTLLGGEQLTAAVTDIDGTVSNLSWEWARGTTATGPFTDIASSNSLSYTLVNADVGKYLRATASYTDPQASGKTAHAVTSGAVEAGNSEPTFSSDTATRTLPENSGAGVNVLGGTITATDSDSGDALTYGLSGTDAGLLRPLTRRTARSRPRPGSPTTSTSRPRRTPTPSP